MEYSRKPKEWTSPTGITTKLYPIGYVAGMLGRSSQTIRKWEVSGVIPATPFKDKNGNRLYSTEHIDSLVKNAEEFRISIGRKMADGGFTNHCYSDFDDIKVKFFGGEKEYKKIKRHRGRIKDEIEEERIGK